MTKKGSRIQGIKDSRVEIQMLAAEFMGSLKKYPQIQPGTPDPYTAPKQNDKGDPALTIFTKMDNIP